LNAAHGAWQELRLAGNNPRLPVTYIAAIFLPVAVIVMSAQRRLIFLRPHPPHHHTLAPVSGRKLGSS